MNVRSVLFRFDFVADMQSLYDVGSARAVMTLRLNMNDVIKLLSSLHTDTRGFPYGARFGCAPALCFTINESRRSSQLIVFIDQGPRP